MGIYDNIVLPWPEWKITARLGHGSFGSVYKIERQLVDTKEECALKIISIPQDEDEISENITNYGYDRESLSETYKTRMQDVIREYELMAQLSTHPNIVGCRDIKAVPHADGIGWDVFIRMDLLTPLMTYKNSHAFSEKEVLRLGLDMCGALEACEKLNIIHRDVKPENIMVDSAGHFRLGDFGVARTMEHTTSATQAGTERYMAPEVLRHEPYGKTVDIYSLGLVLYWLLNNGRLPFVSAEGTLHPGDEERAQAERLTGEEFPAPANGGTGFFQIIKKACRFKSSERYASAADMQQDLEWLEKSETIGDEIVSIPGYAPGSQTAASQTAGNQAAGGQTAADPAAANQKDGKGWDDTVSETIGWDYSGARDSNHGKYRNETFASPVGRPGQKKQTGGTAGRTQARAQDSLKETVKSNTGSSEQKTRTKVKTKTASGAAQGKKTITESKATTGEQAKAESQTASEKAEVTYEMLASHSALIKHRRALTIFAAAVLAAGFAFDEIFGETEENVWFYMIFLILILFNEFSWSAIWSGSCVRFAAFGFYELLIWIWADSVGGNLFKNLYGNWDDYAVYETWAEHRDVFTIVFLILSVAAWIAGRIYLSHIIGKCETEPASRKEH